MKTEKPKVIKNSCWSKILFELLYQIQQCKEMSIPSEQNFVSVQATNQLHRQNYPLVAVFNKPLLSVYGPGRASRPPSRIPLPPLIGPPLRSSRPRGPPPLDFPVDCSTLIVAPLKFVLCNALIAIAASSSRAMWTKPYRCITSHSVTSPNRVNSDLNSSFRQFSGRRPTKILVFRWKVTISYYSNINITKMKKKTNKQKMLSWKSSFCCCHPVLPECWTPPFSVNKKKDQWKIVWKNKLKKDYFVSFNLFLWNRPY